MSKYGEIHSIFDTHHVETKAKLDSLLAKNAEIDLNTDSLEAKHDTGNASLASLDGKITACDTGAVVVASSALPAGAASEASLAAQSAKIVACNTGAVVVASSALPSGAADSTKQDEIKALITATNTALAGTLSVSSSGGSSLSKSSSTPLSAQSINSSATHTSSEIDVSSTRHLAILGSSSELYFSHELDVLVSNVSGGTFFKTSHSGYFLDGEFHMHIQNHPYKYIKIQVKNVDTAVPPATFTVHLLSSD